MALVRVYCGISSAETASGTANRTEPVARLTVAIVDNSGRLLDFCEVNDDPAGYAALGTLFAERFGGSAVVTVASDGDDQLVVSLLAASGRAVAYTDDETADDFAERFADDDSPTEIQAAPQQRRAVGLARALQAGALAAGIGPAPREFATLRPVLAAYEALAAGRHATAGALREVLRELYPAALRAYHDPAHPVALAVLDALPQPNMLSTQNGRRDGAVTADSVAARLVADQICDKAAAVEAVTALRVAIAETPRRGGVAKYLAEPTVDAVRNSVAAVRCTDQAAAALMRTLHEQFATVTPPAAGRRPVTIAPVPGFELTPAGGMPTIPAQRRSGTMPPAEPPAAQPSDQQTPADTGAPFVPALTQAAINLARTARSRPAPADQAVLIDHAVPAPATPTDIPVVPEPMPGSRANWPLTGEPDDAAGSARAPERIAPPWQDEALVQPALRLVEPLPEEPPRQPQPAPIAEPRIPLQRRIEREPAPPNGDDTDLLIFASVSSAWFAGEDEGEATWNSALDSSWQVAEEVSLRPSTSGATQAGLPRRVPQANLVPGSPTSPERPLRIIRNAGELAAHTSNYFRGWRLGNQEAGGYSLGGRPGRGSASGWDFSREPEPQGTQPRDDGYHHQAANYR